MSPWMGVALEGWQGRDGTAGCSSGEVRVWNSPVLAPEGGSRDRDVFCYACPCTRHCLKYFAV